MWQLPCKCNMNVLPIILTELWMDEYPKCPVRDKTNTEESPNNTPLGGGSTSVPTDVEPPPTILGYTLGEVVVREGENSIWSGRWSCLRDGRWSGIVQTENTVRHWKYGRIRGMVVGEGGRSSGVLLYEYFWGYSHSNILFYILRFCPCN